MFSKAFDTPKAYFFSPAAGYLFCSFLFLKELWLQGRRGIVLEFSAMIDAPYAIREMNLSCRAAAGSCFFSFSQW